MAACSAKSRTSPAAGTSPITVLPSSGATTVQPSGPSTGLPTAGLPTAGLRPSATQSSASPDVTALGSSHVSGDVVTQADARRFAPLVNGSWAGAWRDDSGRSGTSDITLAVDPMRLKARGTLAFDGPILVGAPVPPATYQIDLLGFGRDAATWTVVTPQFGSAAVTADGGVNATATCHDIPGAAAGTRLEMTGTRLGGRVDVRYTITDGAGRKTTGTAAWGKGTVRATPQDPSNTKHDSIADILSGAYATDFLTAIDLSKAVGRPMKLPIDNGGRPAYDVGVDVSNTYAETVDGFLRVDLRVFRATSAATAAAFWKTQLLNQPNVAGPWKAGFFQGPGYAVLYSWVGNLVFLTQVGPTVAGAKRIPPSKVMRHECQAVAAAVARAASKL
jgi:hypothetical protein